MRIRLVQIDGKYPNLALMKISSYKKIHGHITGFHVQNPDEVWISSIFTWNKEKVLQEIRQWKGKAKIKIGGSGVSLKIKLPDKIEHIMPDYDLYNIDYSLGFTSRGCIRNCPFCIVPKKEGHIREHSPFSEFVHPNHKKIVLLDNNFLASPKWKEKLKYLIDNNYRVCFNQGLDIRLINEESASLLADVKSRDLHFKCRRYYFAWDLLSYSKQVIKGIDYLKAAGIRGRDMMFYVLVGFNTSFEEDLYRVHKLIQLGCLPFVMKYNNANDKKLNALAKWVNRRYYRVVKWEDFNLNKWNDEYDVNRILEKYDRKLSL